MILAIKFKAAFTLIELLVTLGIIAILATLAFPTITSAIEHARSSKCISNLRQIGIGLNLYLSDHDERMPIIQDDQFKLLLEPYIGSDNGLFLCPSNSGHSQRSESSYQWNSGLNGQLSTSLKVEMGSMVFVNRHDIVVLNDRESWHQNRKNFLYADGSAGNHPLTLPTP